MCHSYIHWASVMCLLFAIDHSTFWSSTTEENETIELLISWEKIVLLNLSIKFKMCRKIHSTGIGFIDITMLLPYICLIFVLLMHALCISNFPKFSDRQDWATSIDPARLLLEEQSDQDLHFCHSVCIFWTHYSNVEPCCSNFRIITTVFRCPNL